jgi:UDP-N-acetyl-D-mannosaminuronic acid dehydrogenase
MINKVCVIGLGYIGLPTVAMLAKNNIEVHGVDIKQDVINTINSGKIHIVEEGLEELISQAVDKGLLKASTKAMQADVYLIVVPTPFKNNNEPDISYIKAATESTLHLLKPNDLFIIESTSPVGTTNTIAQLIGRNRPDLLSEDGTALKIDIAYCPERVLPGNVIYELQHNDRVIGGLTEQASEHACEFYRLFVTGELHKTNAQTAEMCKLTENASRDVAIAFANELSLICDKSDIDVWELIKLANKHPRVNILMPGCGVGGHCIAVDPWFIVSQFPLESRIISTAREINNHKAFWSAEKIIDSIKQYKIENMRQPNVALMGLAFKPNIDDLRESPAKYIVSKVFQHDVEANFSIVEPNISNHNIYNISDYQTAYDNADIVVFLVAHDEFKSLCKDDGKLILDLCGVTKI